MTSANDFKDKGNEAMKAGNAKEAVEHYSSAIALDGDNHVFFSNRSAAYCKLEQFDKALEDANECVKVNPKWGKVSRWIAFGVLFAILVFSTSSFGRLGEIYCA